MNIENLIDNYLKKKKEQDDKDHSEYSGLISASMLGQCHRRQFYAIKKIEQTNPPDDRTFRVFACGNVFHQFIQDIAKKEIVCQEEVVFKDSLVSVRCDLLTDTEIYEFKSMHSKGFWYMQDELKKGKSILEIKPDHCLQLGLGAITFNRKIANLVYVSKDDLCIKQFTLNVNELAPLVYKELLLVKTMLAVGVLPPPEPRLYSKDRECSYCNFRDRCKTEREV